MLDSLHQIIRPTIWDYFIIGIIGKTLQCCINFVGLQLNVRTLQGSAATDFKRSDYVIQRLLPDYCSSENESTCTYIVKEKNRSTCAKRYHKALHVSFYHFVTLKVLHAITVIVVDG